MGLLWSKYRTWHWVLLHLIQLALAHWWSLSRSLCKPSYPQTDQHTCPTWCCLQSYWECTQYLVLIVDKDVKPFWTTAEPWGTGSLLIVFQHSRYYSTRLHGTSISLRIPALNSKSVLFFCLKIKTNLFWLNQDASFPLYFRFSPCL